MNTPTILVEAIDSDSRLRRFLIHHELADFYAQALCETILGASSRRIMSPEELPSEVDNVLCWKAEDRLLSQVERIGWFQLTSTGSDQLLPQLWRTHPDTVVATTAGMNADSVAGFALTMLLSLHWGTPGILANQASRTWEIHAAPLFSQSTALVLGLGNVGRRVAEHCAHLGMKVIGGSRSRRELESLDEWVHLKDIDGPLARADHVIICLPFSDETEGLLGERRLRLMPPTSFLVNVGRGGIVDEHALASALVNGSLAGAALDVFRTEPLPKDSVLWRTPGLIVSPHMAGERADYREAARDIWLENIERWDLGEQLLRMVQR